MSMTAKTKRHTTLHRHWLNPFLRATRVEMTVPHTARQCTRLLSELVCYPQLTNDLGRTTRFKRLGDGAFTFEIRSRRYLGRGTYVLSARAAGTILHDPATGNTHVQGVVRHGSFYLLALLAMTAWALGSFLLVPVTIMFLPLSLLMTGIVGMHWRYLLHDRATLYDDLQLALAPSCIHR